VVIRFDQRLKRSLGRIMLLYELKFKTRRKECIEFLILFTVAVHKTLEVNDRIESMLRNLR